MTDIDVDGLKRLREPFAPNQIGKLPKGGIFLDFVGHAVLTARLLEVDPLWTWEPLALDPAGLPAFDEYGGLWIKLTVCGMTRLGYGDADGKTGHNATKIAIGDALRNAGMRFGLALDLWTKSDLDATPAAAGPPPRKPRTDADVARAELLAVCNANGLDVRAVGARFATEFGLAVADADAVTVQAFKQMLADEAAAPA